MALSLPALARSRLAWLLQTQNPDGGWGYQAGKASWLEPTVYALRAMTAGDLPDPAVESARRAQHYVDRLQRSDGAWQASLWVPERHWSGALWLGLPQAPRERTMRWRAGMDWLLAEKGREGGWLQHLAEWLDPEAIEENLQLRGWPWLEGTNSWVEPTCHAMLALGRAGAASGRPGLAARLQEGQRLLLDRRCRDGGWNYGNRRVRGHDLPSYPQTTALALLTLQRCGATGLQPSVERAQRYWADASVSRLARVWLALALREVGLPVPLDAPPDGTDTITAALEAVAWSAKGYV